MNAKSILYLCNKLKPRPKSSTRKTSKDGDTSRQLPQSPSETNANAAIASTSSSAQGATQSVQRSRLSSRPTRYVIIASQNSRSKPKEPEREDAIEPGGMPELSAHEPLPHAEWNQRTGIGTVEAHTTKRRQNDGLDFFRGLTYRSRLPRRYPPTSYRGPSPLYDEDKQPLLHAEFNQPEPVSPSETAIGSAAKLSNSEEQDATASPGTTPNSDDATTTTAYTRADMSNDRRQIASSSLESSASKSPPCSEGGRRHHHQQERSRPVQPPLPPPEEVYVQLMYYTHCPHTCPPAHRPLNAPPVLQDLTPDLLHVPVLSSPAIASQLDLAARTGRSRQIYTIAGLCPDCDLHGRRAAESEVLAAFTERRRLLRRRRHRRHLGNDELRPLLAQLDRDQDRQVKKIWTGFAARWGPGAIGIQRTTSSSSSSSSREVEGRMKLDWLRPDLSKDTYS